MTQISKVLYFSRIDKGLAQNMLAEKLGVTAQFVGRVEKGKCKPPMKLIKLWMDLVEADKFLVKSALLSDYESEVNQAIRG